MGQKNILQCTRLEQMSIITNNLTVLLVQVKVNLASRNHFLPDTNYHLIQHFRDRHRAAGHQGRKKKF